MTVEAWRDSFKSSCIRTGFTLALSRPMLEFLSAVADDVHWDRAVHGSASACPDNFIATSRSLVKRGLIQQKKLDPAGRHAQQAAAEAAHGSIWTWTHWELTPAGQHVVELLKIAGLFIEADAAIHKKARKHFVGSV